MTAPVECCWANDRGANGMPTPADLEAQGWTRWYQHPWWPASWMMRREG